MFNLSCAPICVFAYNRPIHLASTLRNLEMCKMCEKSDLFIFCDGSKNEKDKDKVLQVRELVQSFAKHNKFQKTEIIFQDKNIGLANSIINGVTAVIDKYGKAIVFEDDLIASRDCLIFLNQCLNYYESDDSVWSISGFSFPIKSLKNNDSDVFATKRACSWGWGTWKNRWDTVDWNVRDYNKFKFNLHKRRLFAKGGNDMPCMLDRQMNGFIDSWAIRWCYSQFIQNKITIYPKRTRILNIGQDGSGTHPSKSKEKFSDTDFNCLTDESFVLSEARCDKKIEKEFKKRYDFPLFSIVLNFVKNNILHINHIRQR